MHFNFWACFQRVRIELVFVHAVVVVIRRRRRLLFEPGERFKRNILIYGNLITPFAAFCSIDFAFVYHSYSGPARSIQSDANGMKYEIVLFNECVFVCVCECILSLDNDV